MQIKEAITLATQALQNKGIEEPRLEAETLVAHSLKSDRVGIYINYDKLLSSSELKSINSIISKRLNYEPLQYLTNEVNFLGINFIVEPPVFIPRPETEVLVQTLIEQCSAEVYPRLKWWDAGNKPPLYSYRRVTIFDIGTGCGVIGISALKFLPSATVYASDIMSLELAKRNAEKVGVIDRILFLRGNLLEPFKGEKADFVVSNPPYISTQLISKLQPEIRLFESRTSIDGGEDGLFFIRKLIETAPLSLKPSGVLLLEISPEQENRVREKALKHFNSVDFIKDFYGRTRVAKCEKLKVKCVRTVKCEK